MGDTERIRCETDANESFIKLKNDMGSEDIHYSTFYESIPKEFKDLALEELNETESNKRIGLLKLKEFLKGKFITGVEEYMLLTVLRNCKYNTKASEKKLMKYLQFQDMVTKWLQTSDMMKFENILNNKVAGILQYRDKNGRIVFYTTPYDIDFERFSMDDATLCGLCLLLYALSFPMTSIAGVSYIAECKGPSLSVLYPAVKVFRHFIPTIIGLPFRIGKMELINENFIIRWGYNLLRPLVPMKLLKRVTFHGSDMQDLFKCYNSAIIPEEFGGAAGPMNPKLYMEDFFNFVKKLKSRKPFIQQ